MDIPWSIVIVPHSGVRPHIMHCQVVRQTEHELVLANALSILYYASGGDLALAEHWPDGGSLGERRVTALRFRSQDYVILDCSEAANRQYIDAVPVGGDS